MTVAPNTDLLRATLDQILAQPELHHQEYWAKQTDCGTAYCFAGWACVLSGLEARFFEGCRRTEFLTDGRTIDATAQEILGLDSLTVGDLFDPHNDVATLKDYVDQIAQHGRIVETLYTAEHSCEWCEVSS